MTTSIVISTYNRNAQLAQTLASIARQQPALLFPLEVIVVDDGDLSHGHPPAALVCQTFGARCLPCRRPASSQFRNPSLPNNLGIRAASGDVVILQNAECRHEDPEAISKLTAMVTPSSAAFAHVVALNQDGSLLMDYCSPQNPRPYFFCGAIRREWLVRLRGFDQDYWGAGYDDDDLALRLHCEGVQFVYSDVKVVHQWHPPAGDYSSAPQMAALFEEKCGAMQRGELGTVRNPEGWGGGA
jgi:GT2 family glycosyltransferase